jgi:hypothetical protein
MINDALGGVKYLAPMCPHPKTEIDILIAVLECRVEPAKLQKQRLGNEPACSSYGLELAAY